MKKHLLKAFLISILAILFISCSSDDDFEWKQPEIKTTGIYLLNSGNRKANDATLGYYDVEAGKVTEKVFANTNKPEILGDVANDMAIYGSKMYIAVTNSNSIWVTDLKAKIVKLIEPKEGEMPLKPRHVVTHTGKVYVSTETGYLLRIDTASMNMDRIKISDYTEKMVVVNNKLYVTNPTTTNIVSVIDLNNFTSTPENVIVGDNPSGISADTRGNVYVLSYGFYNDDESLGKLHKIETLNKNKVTELGTNVATQMVRNGDRLLMLKEEYDPFKISLLYYDLKKDELIDESFITDGTKVANPYSITTDPLTKNIYVGDGNYANSGKMYVFTKEGKLITQFSTGGFYPMGAYFLTETK